MPLLLESPFFLIVLLAIGGSLVDVAMGTRPEWVSTLLTWLFAALGAWTGYKGTLQYKKGEAYRQLSLLNIAIGLLTLAMIVPKILFS